MRSKVYGLTETVEQIKMAYHFLIEAYGMASFFSELLLIIFWR